MSLPNERCPCPLSCRHDVMCHGHCLEGTAMTTNNQTNEQPIMKVGGKYNWKNQSERLVYLGKQGAWHQFALTSKQNTVWCEVLDEDLHMLEYTKVGPTEQPAGDRAELIRKLREAETSLPFEGGRYCDTVSKLCGQAAAMLQADAPRQAMKPLTDLERMKIIGYEFPLALVDPIVIAKIDSVCKAIEAAHGIK